MVRRRAVVFSLWCGACGLSHPSQPPRADAPVAEASFVDRDARDAATAPDSSPLDIADTSSADLVTLDLTEAERPELDVWPDDPPAPDADVSAPDATDVLAQLDLGTDLGADLGTPLDDGPVIQDAGVADTPVAPPDVPLDTGPTYDSGRATEGVSSGRCGGNGESCCAGGACDIVNRTCMQQPGETQPYCRDCGGNDRYCCEYGRCDMTNRVCQLRVGETVPHCHDCGGNNQPCCAFGRCDPGRTCVAGTSFPVCR